MYILIWTDTITMYITDLYLYKEMEFIETTKGGCQIVLDGYLYQKNKSLSSGITYWEYKRL